MTINNNFYLSIKDGFGNKIYRIIIGLYIKQINNKTFNSMIKKSKHDDDNYTYHILNIFPNLKKEITLFDNYEILDKYFPLDERINIDCSYNFDFYFQKSNKPIFLQKVSKCFKYIFEIYPKLDLKYKKILEINEAIISKNIVEMSKNEFVLVHIRYGDKLDISHKAYYRNKKENIFKFITYKPEYYIKMIKKFQKKNKKILIISDDNTIVKKFILNKINYDNIHLLDISFLDSFYLLTKAKYIILSISTFSFLGMLINLNLKKAYYLKRPNELNKFIIPEEIHFNTNKLKIYENKKYILNYDQKLMYNMIKSR
jgi:hypothetical protein